MLRGFHGSTPFVGLVLHRPLNRCLASIRDEIDKLGQERSGVRSRARPSARMMAIDAMRTANDRSDGFCQKFGMFAVKGRHLDVAQTGADSAAGPKSTSPTFVGEWDGGVENKEIQDVEKAFHFWPLLRHFAVIPAARPLRVVFQHEFFRAPAISSSFGSQHKWHVTRRPAGADNRITSREARS